MRTLLQNLLILFALSLCVLIAVQWHRESSLRTSAGKAAESAKKDQQTIESLRSDLKHADIELARVNATGKQLADADRSTRADLKRNEAELERISRELASHKAALAKANENITAQNEAMKKLAGERDGAVSKFNSLVEEHNALVKQWNAQQEQAAPAKK